MDLPSEFFTSLITFCLSMFAMGTSLYNSLDFISYCKNTTIIYRNITNTSTNFATHETHQTWGAAGIVIIFLPGMVMLPYGLYGAVIKERNLFSAIVFLVLFPIYPATLVIVQLAILYITINNVKQDNLDMTNVLIGFQAFFQCFPQIVLQGYTTIYGYETTKTQLIAIFACFILLVRTSMNYEIMMNKRTLTFVEPLTHKFKSFQCYAANIIFRSTSLSITIAFLRELSFIPICIIFVELVILSFIRYRKAAKKSDFFQCMYLSSLTNLGALNPSGMHDHGDDDLNNDLENTFEDKRGRQFVKMSSIVTFVHHALVLVSIMIPIWSNSKYFEQEHFKNVILIPGENNFLWLIGVTIMFGFYAMVLSMYLI